MANIREIKLHIKSIEENQKITRAMKLIAASKLKKARHQLEQTLPYFRKVESTMADILAHSAGMESPYFAERRNKSEKVTGIIVLGGDRSLAGSYNHNVIRTAEDLLKDVRNPILFVAGQMGKNYFIRKGFPVQEEFDFPVQNPSLRRVREITFRVLDMFQKEELDEVYVVYTEMISPIRLEPQAFRLLPLSLDALRAKLDKSREAIPRSDNSILYEPSPESVFSALIPQYMQGVLYGAFTESFTSEQSARMSAMDSATSNAEKMLQTLNLRYNRARQAAITQEITEIVSGSAAL